MRTQRDWEKHEQRQAAEIRMLRRELEAARSYIDELEDELLTMIEAQPVDAVA